MIFESKELEIHIYGRVQGVNFRNILKREAENKGLTGFAMNRVDGSVEVVVQGKTKLVEQYLHWIQCSPGFSSVRGLSYHWRSVGQEFDSFQVIKDSSFVIDKVKSFVHLGKSFLPQKSLKVPLHLAIIPDGNRRWAKKKGKRPEFGHYTAASFQHLQELFEEARKFGVKYLTLWGFSTENWKRDSLETKAIFDLLLQNIERFRDEAHSQKIRFRHLGRKDRLPKGLLHALEKLEKETAIYTEFNVQLCLDYGGKDELLRAVNAILKQGIRSIDELNFSGYLDSASIPDVDLVVRTSGEQRLSGFMPFQSAYAELYFSNVHFPDFTAKELRKAIEEYSKRQRRFGGG